MRIKMRIMIELILQMKELLEQLIERREANVAVVSQD